MSYPFQHTDRPAYDAAYRRSVQDPEGFWADVAANFTGVSDGKTLEWNFRDPDVKWFSGGKLNITENCLDRHLGTLGNKPAIIWEPNDPEEHHRVLTYRDLHTKVVQFANVLKNNGVKKGDRVCIYMGMVPELAIAVLACARIGAIHSVVFGGFSAQSIADRLTDAQAEFIVTSDGAFRGNKEIGLKSVIDDALVQCRFVKRVIVLTRTRTPVSMIKGRDVWWEDEIRKVETMGNPDCPAEEMDAEDPLFILTLPDPPESRKASCIRVRAIWCTPPIRSPMYFSTARARSSSVQPTLAGSPDTAISCTVRSAPAPPRSCSKGFPPGRTLEGFGISSTSTT